MRDHAPVASWAALFISTVTLALVISMTLGGQPNDASLLEDRFDQVMAILEGESTFGTVSRGGLVGDVSSLDTRLSELAGAVDELRSEVAAASSSSGAAASASEDVLNALDTISAQLSDICFRLEAC